MQFSYKTELHAHSLEVSACANANAAYLAGRYLAEGYSALVLTNHWNLETFHSPRYTGDPADHRARTAYFFDGIRKAQKAAEATALTVLAGMELRLEADGKNDYLLYGITEEFVLSHPELQELTLEELSALTRESGILLIQAHPFRDGMTVVSPALLDGYEVFNGHDDSRNEIARRMGEVTGKIMTSGSDFHDPENRVSGGIQTKEPIRSSKDLLTVLGHGDYEILPE